MKRILWNITRASLLTLVAYIALFAFWGALLNEIESPTIKLFLVALMTTVAFGFILLYIAKIRKGIGEDEVLSDYEDRAYASLVDDFKLIIQREASMLICMAVIVFLCFVLNTVDSVVFEKKTISFPTFFFAPMCLFDTAINLPFVGYAVSAILDCAMYILFLLLYRKKKYNYWMKNKM